MVKNKWISFSNNREDAKLNLLCFPYAGGSPSFFAQWKRIMPEEINMCPVLYPFREVRRSEQMPDTIQELAKDFVDNNEELFQKPFAVFGHCAGGTIGYEVCVEARKKYGVEPVYFVASGEEPPEYSLEAFQYLEDASNEEMLDYLIEHHFAEESIRTNKGFLDYYLPIIRVDFNMLYHYHMTVCEKFNCPIYVITGEGDQVIEKERLDNWNKYTNGKVSYMTFPGDHYYLAHEAQALCNLMKDFYEESVEISE